MSFLQITELTRWILLGFSSEEEILKDWNYHCSSNYEVLQKYIEGARTYGNGDPKKEAEFLELRLPLALYPKNIKRDGRRYVIEFTRMDGDKIHSTIRTHALDVEPSSEYAECLMKHLKTHQFTIRTHEQN